jgi:hypothetical protein
MESLSKYLKLNGFHLTREVRRGMKKAEHDDKRYLKGCIVGTGNCGGGVGERENTVESHHL